jgi:hypothetical protein
MGDPFRTAPPKPIEINGATLMIAIDTIVGSLSIGGGHNLFKYSADQREKVANDLIQIFSDTNFTVVRVDSESK